MSSAFSAIATPSAPLNNLVRTWSTQLSSESSNLVTITSIETETVYPTWVYTISGPGPSSSTATVLDYLTSTLSPTPVTVTLTTTKLSTTKLDATISTASSTTPVISEPPVSTPIPTSVLSSSMVDFPISATSESSDHSWQSDTSSSMWISLTSSIIYHSSSLPVLPETVISSITSMSSYSTSPSSSAAPTNTPSILPFIGTATSASSAETAQADNSSPTSTSKTGTIVGSVIGGSAIMIFALLACALYMRRRRRKITTERLGIRQKLIRGDSASSSVSHHHHHNRHNSFPSIPSNIGPRSPVLPIIPLQQQPSDPNLSLDSMYLRGERAPQGSFADPIIEISAPSRSVSIYSTSSRGAGVGVQGYWDCERDGMDALAVPHVYSDTPVMRDSMRSDPFDLDLEPPPNAHHRSSVPPVPTVWGDNF
ncbi:uncharacterized protein N7479_004571 [Penicillium vulpinum]|uniref:Uncharacterized protein n=1 Tax=Penicillium vulpinum TaxID=29845 RepID=A0A1V6RSB0_9EURO|nr:uncharacterized protein N7479_004571 [Penicillium vulpinum]KAJ5964695.1 hypothetical protein N7479_004571 [Penicillium vulpinum]OQE04303.1 hypothetical protein PENVUL_c034G09230 [Penicillium vulpinum]